MTAGADTLLDRVREVYERDAVALGRAALAICGDPDAARDAVHEAFVTAVKKLHTYAGTGSLEGWVWRIVVNKAAEERRLRTRARLLEYDDARDRREAPPRTDLEGLRKSLLELPERQRLAIFLRYYADLDYSQISETLGISSGTVAATLHAAHASLRERWEGVDVRSA